MPIKHSEDAVFLGANLNLKLCDLTVLHVLAPALHLSTGIAHTSIRISLGLFLSLGLGEVDAHPIKFNC